MYAVVVTFRLNPGQMEAFLPHMLENAKASRETEPGCQRFDVCTDPDMPDTVFLYEIYDDRAAFEAHMQTAHFAKVNAATEGMAEDKDIRTFSRVVG